MPVIFPRPDAPDEYAHAHVAGVELEKLRHLSAVSAARVRHWPLDRAAADAARTLYELICQRGD
jgi:hypothetical protein